MNSATGKHPGMRSLASDGIQEHFGTSLGSMGSLQPTFNEAELMGMSPGMASSPGLVNYLAQQYSSGQQSGGNTQA